MKNTLYSNPLKEFTRKLEIFTRKLEIYKKNKAVVILDYIKYILHCVFDLAWCFILIVLVISIISLGVAIFTIKNILKLLTKGFKATKIDSKILYLLMIFGLTVFLLIE